MTDKEIRLELLQIIRKRDERDKEMYERITVVETLSKETRDDIKEIKDGFADFKKHLDGRCQRHSDKIDKTNKKVNGVEIDTNKRIDKAKWVVLVTVITFALSLFSFTFTVMRYAKGNDTESKVIKTMSTHGVDGKMKLNI